MKRIEAIIRPSKLETLKIALNEAKVNGVTINQVMGCGKQLGWTDDYGDDEEIINILSKIEVKMVVEDERLEDIIELIISITRTGNVGDGKIFISDVCDCIRIRTGERGRAAL